jgi:hypothetical protein
MGRVRSADPRNLADVIRRCTESFKYLVDLGLNLAPEFLQGAFEQSIVVLSEQLLESGRAELFDVIAVHSGGLVGLAPPGSPPLESIG